MQQRIRELTGTVRALETEVARRQRVEDALRESERRYRELFESSRGLMCTHDLEGTVLSVNPAAAGLLGYAPADIIGQNLREFLAPSVRDLLPAYLERLRHAPTATDDGLARVVKRNGEERVWAYSNVRHEERGRPPYVLGHAQDITDLRRAHTLQRQAEALRSVAHLALATAHEINNPLTVIIASLQLITARGHVAESAARYVERAIRAAEQVSNVVRQMSRITRLELARQNPSILDIQRSSEVGSPSPGP